MNDKKMSKILQILTFILQLLPHLLKLLGSLGKSKSVPEEAPEVDNAGDVTDDDFAKPA